MGNVVPFKPKPMPFSRLLESLSGIVTEQTISIVLIAYEPDGVRVRTFGNEADCRAAIDAAQAAVTNGERT